MFDSTISEKAPSRDIEHLGVDPVLGVNPGKPIGDRHADRSLKKLLRRLGGCRFKRAGAVTWGGGEWK
jgi:hypothetical protein